MRNQAFAILFLRFLHVPERSPFALGIPPRRYFMARGPTATAEIFFFAELISATAAYFRGVFCFQIAGNNGFLLTLGQTLQLWFDSFQDFQHGGAFCGQRLLPFQPGSSGNGIAHQSSHQLRAAHVVLPERIGFRESNLEYARNFALVINRNGNQRQHAPNSAEFIA